MVRLIQGALQMSNHQTLKDLPSVISSQESEDGVEHYNSQDGVQTDLFGQEALPVSPSQQQEKEKEKMTHGIFGQSSLISSESANLQRSLVSKLRQLSDLGGSTIYKLTLKEKVTPQQRQYYQLGASAPHTKGTDSSSWPTPTQRDYKGGRKLDSNAQNSSATTGVRYGLSLDQAPQLVPWLTPTTSDMNGVRQMDGKRSGGLNTQVISAWPTPTHHNSKEGGYPAELTRNTIQLGAMKHIVAWATPNTMDHMKQRSDEALARAKQKAGCSNLKDQIPYSGEAQKSSTAETESTAPSQLNPRFSLWLMGYPIEWAYSGERVMPSSRKRQRKS
jgi:hypothetical protein